MGSMKIIAIDLGGTKLNIGLVCEGELIRSQRYIFDAAQSKEKILEFVVSCIDEFMEASVTAIGIGVPSIVDVEGGIVYDTVNIPAWREVTLKKDLENIFAIPVFVNNDVNCFVLGEKCYGKARPYSDVVGICLGTGMGVGLIINNRLHQGKNCGAGEIGSIPYLKGSIEDYCSGYFFQHFHSITGKELFQQASLGDRQALSIFHEFGLHLGKAISMIVLAFDPEAIILGGAVANAYPFFISTVKKALSSLPFSRMAERIIIEQSDNQNIALLGAAALCLQNGGVEPKFSNHVAIK